MGKISETLDFYIAPEQISQLEHYGKQPEATAISPAGAVGLMQIMERGALADWNRMNPDEQYNIEDMKDPQKNTRVGNWFSNEMIPQYFGTWGIPVNEENVLAAYNMGPVGFKRYFRGQQGMPSETREYLRRAGEMGIT